MVNLVGIAEVQQAADGLRPVRASISNRCVVFGGANNDIVDGTLDVVNLLLTNSAHGQELGGAVGASEGSSHTRLGPELGQANAISKLESASKRHIVVEGNSSTLYSQDLEPTVIHKCVATVGFDLEAALVFPASVAVATSNDNMETATVLAIVEVLSSDDHRGTPHTLDFCDAGWVVAADSTGVDRRVLLKIRIKRSTFRDGIALISTPPRVISVKQGVISIARGVG